MGHTVGRARELAEIEALVGNERLVTLTGTGGNCKTRLALDVGATVSDRFSDGVVFVDLAHVRDAELVPATIAAALGMRRHPRRTIIDTLVENIGDRSLLLILDNFEQLRGAELDAALLGRCPHLHVLAMSRAPLHVRGERAYPLGSLATPATRAEADVAPVAGIGGSTRSCCSSTGLGKLIPRSNSPR